jgi:hypothetical protein
MKARAKVRFNVYNKEVQSGQVVDFGDNTEQGYEMLLNLGWIEPLEEGSATATATAKAKAKASKKKEVPTV